MALDGIFLNCLRSEIEKNVLGARVDKIHQPSRDEIIIQFRSREGAQKLILSAKADAPRIHFTDFAPENPAKPPLFCMLMRKYLSGARLTSVTQNGLERVLFLNFEATDELGDKIFPKIIIEIMARHSNLILVDENDKIIDAIKRVDFTKSSVREVLPGLIYQLPPSQDKLNLLVNDLSEISKAILNSDKKLSKSAQNVLQGVSPIVCREFAYRFCDDDVQANSVSYDLLFQVIQSVKAFCESPQPYMIYDVDGKEKDFSFMPIVQYGDFAEVKRFSSFSELLDSFYFLREKKDRIKQRSIELFKQLNTLTERAIRKNTAQKEQLKECDNKEKLKIYGDLISSNLHVLEKGSAFYDLVNYYDEEMKTVRIPADISMTPNQNAQKYYKEYRKLQTAQQMLAEFIKQSEQEALYLESVIDELSRADTDREITEIKEELYVGGYIKHKRGGKQKKSKPLPPMKFQSKDGFEIRVGRNNIQNDLLTIKQSRNYDMWLHTKDIPGSHVVVLSKDSEFTDQAIFDAAMLASYFSKANGNGNVSVDYTIIKNVKKPKDAKPGRVIYENYNTIIVTPTEEYMRSLIANGVS